MPADVATSEGRQLVAKRLKDFELCEGGCFGLGLLLVRFLFCFFFYLGCFFGFLVLTNLI